MGEDRVLVGGGNALWCDLVRAGERHARTSLSEDAESYLVFVLVRHLKDAPLLARVMALEWLHAVDSCGRERQDQLRDVGDRCLLMAGLFPQLAQRRRVDHGYFITLGQGAYDGVAGASRAGYAALFAHLATVYRAMVQVLAGVASISGAQRGPLAGCDPAAYLPAFRRGRTCH